MVGLIDDNYSVAVSVMFVREEVNDMRRVNHASVIVIQHPQ